jgi:hypothetical protein
MHILVSLCVVFPFLGLITSVTTGSFIIIKRCALAPCEFEKDVEMALGFTDKCILSRRDADCVKCCRGAGCNKRTSDNIASQLSSAPTQLTTDTWQILSHLSLTLIGIILSQTHSSSHPLLVQRHTSHFISPRTQSN